MKSGLARFLCLALLVIGSRSLASQSSPADPFPIPLGFEPRIAFWTDVFTRYSSDQVVIHDREKPWIVYDVLRLDAPFDPGDHRQKRLIRYAQRRSPVGDRARFQPGLKQRFAAGIERSGRYLDQMRTIFREKRVPEDLAYLPHVESSFENDARSSAACVGLWQWSRGTGRHYLRIDRGVDERFDPLASTRAAAQHLRDNFEELGSWPLAITAYNHGVGGMRKAREKYGEDRFDLVVDRYRSRSFGFASKNFYAEFLAARGVAMEPQRFFDALAYDPPILSDWIPLEDFLDRDTVLFHLGLSDQAIRDLNPALTSGFREGSARAPRGYILKVPAGEGPKVLEAYRSIPGDERHDHQIPHRFHVVRAGESLSAIAGRYGTSVRRLSRLNDLRNPNRIFQGQKLRIR